MPVIGKKTARAILDVFDEVREHATPMLGPTLRLKILANIEPLYLAVSDALETKRAVKAARKRRVQKKAERRTEVYALRVAAKIRAGGHCENCAAMLPEERMIGGPVMDHIFGGSSRIPLEALETVWMLCPKCNHQRTGTYPTRRHWLERFISHADRQIARLQLESLDTRPKPVSPADAGFTETIAGYEFAIKEAQKRLAKLDATDVFAKEVDA